MNKSEVKHLTKEDIIKNGSFFTPEKIVKICKKYIWKKIDDNSVIIDFGCGYGAFISEFIKAKGKKIATDIDFKSCEIVRQNYNIEVLNENALKNVDRTKFANKNQDIIVIGNPPYNDTTSQYKKGQKGNNDCDKDLFARDLGVSFLKMFNKVEAKYICVLHPLSYLSKRTNFNSLGEFKNNYKLLKGTIFSSANFETIKKTNKEFPVVCALYERNSKGTNYDEILDFKFDVLDSDKHFCLNEFLTIDGVINKYPSKKKNSKDLYFYTIRDINALKRNKTFVDYKCANGVKVDVNNLHIYGWLEYLKKSSLSDNYLIGNLSPVIPVSINEIREDLLAFVIRNNKIVRDFVKAHNKDLFAKYINRSYSVAKLDKAVEEATEGSKENICVNKLKRMKDEDIDLSDIPELTDEQIKHGRKFNEFSRVNLKIETATHPNLEFEAKKAL